MDPIIFLVIASYFLVFGVGYIAGKVTFLSQISSFSSSIQPIVQQSRFPSPQPSIVKNVPEQINSHKIEIDDRMFITEVKTDSLEKKFNDLGKTIVSKDESLSGNVSKLASLKKSKED